MLYQVFRINLDILILAIGQLMIPACVMVNIPQKIEGTVICYFLNFILTQIFCSFWKFTKKNYNNDKNLLFALKSNARVQWFVKYNKINTKKKKHNKKFVPFLVFLRITFKKAITSILLTKILNKWDNTFNSKVGVVTVLHLYGEKNISCKKTRAPAIKCTCQISTSQIYSEGSYVRNEHKT